MPRKPNPHTWWCSRNWITDGKRGRCDCKRLMAAFLRGIVRVESSPQVGAQPTPQGKD